MNIISDSINNAWVSVMQELAECKESSPRGKKVKEKIGVSIKITNPKKRILDLPVRKISLPFAFGELLWYLSGRNDVEMMEYYSKNMKNFSDDGQTLNSAYGYRIFGNHPQIPFDQWKHAVKKLREDRDSRQAIIHLHTPNDKPTKDEVCTLTLQFFIRDGKLDMVTNMRSNDIVWGFTYDVFSFTTFQELMANQLNVEVGTYHHKVGSMHIYEKDFALLDQVNELSDELHYMSHYSTEFDYDGITINDSEWKKLIEKEKFLRSGVQFNRHFEFENDAIKVMERVLHQYQIFKAYGHDKVRFMYDYDNIFDCMMRNYTSGKKLKESSLFIVEGCDGAGKSTFIAKNRWIDAEAIAFGKPKNFNKFIYFHTALLTGDIILDRFFYSELVYSDCFNRNALLSSNDVAVLERLLNYRKATLYHLATPPEVCYQRLDEQDQKDFFYSDMELICYCYEKLMENTTVNNYIRLGKNVVSN